MEGGMEGGREGGRDVPTIDAPEQFASVGHL